MLKISSVLLVVVWLLQLVIVGRCSSRIVHLDSSEQFYDLVHANYYRNKESATNILLYVFKPGCKYCAELEPKLDFLTTVFPNDSTVKFVKVNGQQASTLVKDLYIRSFPQLFIFKPIPGQSMEVTNNIRETVKDNSFLSQFHGERTVKGLAQWISNNVGEMAHWPTSRVNYNIRDIDDFVRIMPQSLIESIFPTDDSVKDSGERPACLAFVNSWMDIQYVDMFNGDLNTLILEKMSDHWRSIDFYVIDSSVPELSTLSTQLQVAHSPTLCFIFKGKIIKSALKPYDDNSRDREMEYFNEIISKCVVPTLQDNKVCEEHINSLPLAEFFTLSPLLSNGDSDETDCNDDDDDDDDNDYDDDDEVPFDVFDL